MQTTITPDARKVTAGMMDSICRDLFGRIVGVGGDCAVTLDPAEAKVLRAELDERGIAYQAATR